MATAPVAHQEPGHGRAHPPARSAAPPHRPPNGAGRRPWPGGLRHWMPAAERTPTMRWQTVARRWLRGVRGWWPDGNPLRRRCDRAEAALLTALVAGFVAGAPLLALPAGRW